MLLKNEAWINDMLRMFEGLMMRSILWLEANDKKKNLKIALKKGPRAVD